MINELLEKVLNKNPDIVVKNVGDEMILVPVSAGVVDMTEVFTLNEVGAFIYDLVDGNRSCKKILDCIVEEFNVSCSVAESDLNFFVTSALEKKVFLV